MQNQYNICQLLPNLGKGNKMRKSLITVFVPILALLLASCGGSSGAGGDTPFDPITYEPLFKATQFTEATVCSGCHVEIYDQWEGSMHFYALEDEFYKGMHALANEQTNGAIDAFCTSCHTPIGTFSGEVPPLEGPDISENSKDGVQCDFCHTVYDADGTGNASFVFKPSDTKRGPFEDAVSPFHKTKYSELQTQSEFCGMCHDVSHPINNVPLESTYTEWKNSPYAEQGVQCQDCHMTPGPSVTKPNPGQAATMGPERPHIWTHQFVGGNATELADEDHQQLAIERLKSAASLSIETVPGASAGDPMQLQVTINNTGAGHYLPTGLTEVREMWLEISITDASGTELFQSGRVDEMGNLDPEVEIYNTTFEDADGNITHLPWKATKVYSDKRVPPMGSLAQDYTVTLPPGAALPLTITAKLNYRTAPQAVVDELLGEASFRVPIIEMATAQMTAG